MEPREALRRCGGRATWAQLRALGVRPRALRAALSTKGVVKNRRGCYRLPDLDEHLDVAQGLAGTLSHRSAAVHHGLEIGTVPEQAEVIVRRNRKLTKADRARASVFHRDLEPHEHQDGVTTPLRTVIDCARDLPFTEALAIADSALRDGLIDLETLRARAEELKGPRSAQVRRVALAANALAANAFESTLRALALEAGLDVRPQVHIAEPGFWGLVDLADEGRKVIIEAESFTHHAHRKGFRKDIRRYTEIAIYGWAVLRFSWEDVMVQPDYVRWVLESWLRVRADLPIAMKPAHLPRLA